MVWFGFFFPSFLFYLFSSLQIFKTSLFIITFVELIFFFMQNKLYQTKRVYETIIRCNKKLFFIITRMGCNLYRVVKKSTFFFSNIYCYTRFQMYIVISHRLEIMIALFLSVGLTLKVDYFMIILAQKMRSVCMQNSRLDLTPCTFIH